VQRRRVVITFLAVALVALMAAAAGSADRSKTRDSRDERGDRLELAGLAKKGEKAKFPVGVPTVAGDPTVRSAIWKKRDRSSRAERLARRGNTTPAAPWDSYAGDVDLKVLLIAADGTEPAYSDWKDLLTREGVPYTAIVAKDAGPLTAETFESNGRALYQAVVLTNDGLYHWNGSAYVSALSPESWTALQAFQTKFRIRQVTSVVYPQPQYGLEYPTYAGDFGGQTAELTTTGKAAFPYLKGTVAYDAGAYGYKAKPMAGANFQTLVQSADGSALLGINTNPDGRQELVSTVAQNQWMTQSRLLSTGILNWVTRGVRLGENRNYFSLHVDDAFYGNDRWDTVNNVTDYSGENLIVMNPSDVDRAVAWQRSSGIRLDMAYNGGAAPEYPALAQALLRNKSNFGWINHTFTHLNLDAVNQATIVSEIKANIDFARKNRLRIDTTELVTGEHSGLNNPEMAAALAEAGIRFIASDSSREASQRLIGPSLTVRRYPMNIFYNVGTREEQLDEYNYIYYEACTIGCLSAPATWDQYVANEVTILFRHITQNDANPHYSHVSNLAEDGTMYPVIDAALAQYRSYFTAPLVVPTQTQAGEQQRRQAEWAQALANGQVTATLRGSRVYVSAPAGVFIPVTGVREVSTYGTLRTGWERSDGSETLTVASASRR
jgi:hypothetical protein